MRRPWKRRSRSANRRTAVLPTTLQKLRALDTLYSTDYLAIHLHAHPRVLEIEWLDFTSGPEFREGVMRALEAGRAHQVAGWINNNRRSRAVRAADQAWYEAEAAPQFFTLTELRCLALVTAEDAMNQLAVRDLSQRQPPPMSLPFAYTEVASIAEARAWTWAQLAQPTNPTP